MTEQMEKANLRFMKPVESLPIRMRERHSFYEGIVDEFVESGLKYAMVNDMGKKPITVAYGLRRALEKRGIKSIKVCQIKNQIYLKKLG